VGLSKEQMSTQETELETLDIYIFQMKRMLVHRAISLSCVVAIVILVLTVIGCSRNSDSPQEPARPSGPLLSIDPTTVGTITGTVTLEGNALDMGAIGPPCVKEGSSNAAPPANKENNGELINAVIYLKTGLANYRYDTPKDPVTLDQRDCTYEPHVIALMTNQPLEVKNNDPVAHNIHVLAKLNKEWNHSEPPGVAPLMVSFPRPELAIHVICKLHVGMSAFLFVFDNPYYAVTSPTGTYELKNVPPGTYTVEAWRQNFGTQDQTVTIGPNQSKALSFVFKSGNSSGD
jgi:hypothetical protein